VLRALTIGAALLVGAAPIGVATAQAAPTQLTVRIEGATRTLFEGPILTDGHMVRASSDLQARPCDGTNGGAHPAPGPTPTAAAADAMEAIGQGFDGRWFPGFDDYFISRWGPDAEDPEHSAFWGIRVDDVLIAVGGCQWADQAGDEVLWAYDSFSGRSLLRLAAAGDPSQAPAAPTPTAHVEVGQPLGLEVQEYSGGEGQAPAVGPAAGVTVAPVQTEAGTGYETVETADAAAVTTAADGSASVTFGAAGWHRLKAQREAGHIRSNRLDVCVEPPGGGSCGPLPGDAQLRVPPRYSVPAQGGPPGTPPPETAKAGPSPPGRFALRAVTIDPRAGTASIQAVVPGPGRLGLAGDGVKPRSLQVGGAGEVRLTVVPAPALRAALRRHGRAEVAVRVEFRPAGGEASSRVRDLTLRMRTPPR
jgi:hypothetical protein